MVCVVYVCAILFNSTLKIVDDWKEWGVLSSLEIIDPPHFLMLGEDQQEGPSEPSEVIQKHYNDIVGELEDGGYERLVTLESRLTSHLSEVEDQVKSWRGRVQNVNLQLEAYRQRLQKIAAEGAENPPQFKKVPDSLLSTPIGKQWFTDGKIEADPEGNWDVSETQGFDSAPPLSNLTIRYEVTEEALHRFQLPRGYGYDEFDLESFQNWPFSRFSGDTTWESVFESLKKHLKLARDHESRATRTLKFLRFRLSIVGTVLYRYEVFGSVYEMTDEEAQEIADKTSPGRKRRIENPDEILKTLNVVCQWLDTEPRPVFKGQGGLVGFASENFSHLTEDGVRDRIRDTFQQLADEYPGLPVPHLGTGTNGRKYVESESEIRELRDEYKARFVEK